MTNVSGGHQDPGSQRQPTSPDIVAWLMDKDEDANDTQYLRCQIADGRIAVVFDTLEEPAEIEKPKQQTTTISQHQCWFLLQPRGSNIIAQKEECGDQYTAGIDHGKFQRRLGKGFPVMPDFGNFPGGLK